MKFKFSRFGKIVGLITFFVLCLLVYSSGIGIAMGQKRPGSLNQGTTADDKKLCNVKNADIGKGKDAAWLNDESEFCSYYKSYWINVDSDPAKAQKARNRMIDLVQSQIEIYYKARKDNRKKLVANLQMVFDVLEIGSAAAAGIIKGTLRAKTIIAQALSGFQSGRTAFNRNFDILQTQVLINTMNTNRAKIMTEIAAGKSQNVDDYTWYRVKADLIRLLNAGTFSDALDFLVKKTGQDAANAEIVLKQVEGRNIITEFTDDDTALINEASDILSTIEEKLDANADDAAATKAARDIFDALKSEPKIGDFLAAKNITNTSKGKDVLGSLDAVFTHFTRQNDRDSMRKIAQAIVKAGKISN